MNPRRWPGWLKWPAATFAALIGGIVFAGLVAGVVDSPDDDEPERSAQVATTSTATVERTTTVSRTETAPASPEAPRPRRAARPKSEAPARKPGRRFRDANDREAFTSSRVSCRLAGVEGIAREYESEATEDAAARAYSETAYVGVYRRSAYEGCARGFEDR